MSIDTLTPTVTLPIDLEEVITLTRRDAPLRLPRYTTLYAVTEIPGHTPTVHVIRVMGDCEVRVVE